jgi:hypothetical protein
MCLSDIEASSPPSDPQLIHSHVHSSSPLNLLLLLFLLLLLTATTPAVPRSALPFDARTNLKLSGGGYRHGGVVLGHLHHNIVAASCSQHASSMRAASMGERGRQQQNTKHLQEQQQTQGE